MGNYYEDWYVWDSKLYVCLLQSNGEKVFIEHSKYRTETDFLGFVGVPKYAVKVVQQKFITKQRVGDFVNNRFVCVVESDDFSSAVYYDTHNYLHFSGEKLLRWYKPEDKNFISIDFGYHTKKIEKGVIGEVSKIQEEFEEFKDATEQGNLVMAQVELSDMLGAIEQYLIKNIPCISLQDLIKMKDATKKAFETGYRT